MSYFEICRICTKLTKIVEMRELFEDSKRRIIQIEQLTGILLQNMNQLPQYICNTCVSDLEKAYEFRERVILTQEYFKRNDYREHLHKPKESIANNTKIDTGERCFVNREICGNENLRPIGNCAIAMNDGIVEDVITAKTDPVTTEKMIIHCKKRKALYSACKQMQKKKHKDKNHFICDQCGNYFTCRYHFLTHLRRHAGDKQFQCEFCPDKFFTHPELKRHMRKHTGERPFACRHCGRRFADYSTRIKHERTHTNERPFVCAQCTKAFTTSYILKNHMLVHTGERSFKCELCNKAFQRQTHLVVHFRSIMHKQNEEKKKKRIT